MSSKEIQFTQAIIDNNNAKINTLIKDRDLKEWISTHVPKNQLKNHGLPDRFKWTTAISGASRLSSVSVLQQVMDAGAHLFNINSNGHTALTWACLHNTDTLQNKF